MTLESEDSVLQPKNYVWYSTALVGALYFLSFLLPAAPSDVPGLDGVLKRQALTGAQCFVLTAQATPLLSVVWLANPIFWLGLYTFARRRWLLTWFVALTALLFGLNVDWRNSYLAGYYLWLGSMGLLAVLGLLGSRLAKERKTASCAGRRPH